MKRAFAAAEVEREGRRGPQEIDGLVAARRAVRADLLPILEHARAGAHLGGLLPSDPAGATLDPPARRIDDVVADVPRTSRPDAIDEDAPSGAGEDPEFGHAGAGAVAKVALGKRRSLGGREGGLVDGTLIGS